MTCGLYSVAGACCALRSAEGRPSAPLLWPRCNKPHDSNAIAAQNAFNHFLRPAASRASSPPHPFWPMTASAALRCAGGHGRLLRPPALAGLGGGRAHEWQRGCLQPRHRAGKEGAARCQARSVHGEPLPWLGPLLQLPWGHLLLTASQGLRDFVQQQRAEVCYRGRRAEEGGFLHVHACILWIARRGKMHNPYPPCSSLQRPRPPARPTCRCCIPH